MCMVSIARHVCTQVCIRTHNTHNIRIIMCICEVCMCMHVCIVFINKWAAIVILAIEDVYH